MIQKKENPLIKLKKIVLEEKKITKELISLSETLEKTPNSEEKNMISSQINSLKNSLIKKNNEIPESLDKIIFIKPLKTQKKHEIKPLIIKKSKIKKINLKKKIPKEEKLPKEKLEFSEFEKKVIKRLKKKEKKTVKEEFRKPSKYVKLANIIFSKLSKNIVKKEMFSSLKKNLVKTNLQFIPTSYISVILLTTFLSIIIGTFIFTFLLFFNLGGFPIITQITENILTRFFKISWILIAFPLGTFLFMYFYPAMERKSIGDKINQELPFATIHMAAISGSMVNPSKIFEIMILTKEYPNIEREFIKLMNEINIYGYDLVSSLKKVALNCPSQKLVELFNGLATTITSGGDLPRFFNKRSETLLLEHRLEREKYTKSAETFMDIYISVVIAAPMILMLLLIMMKISGFGIALSTSMITLIMVLGVSMINVVFLTFLKLKQPST